MIEIQIKNMQAISDATITLGENSITEFSGDNSNGKSIIAKVLEKLTSGDIRSKSARLSLIKDGCEYGAMSITHNKQQLVLVIYEEISMSKLIFVPDTDNDKQIVRGLSDKAGTAKILHKFGFRTYGDGDICLQVSPTYGPIPFVSTSGSVNTEIVKDITMDRIAEEFLNTFKTITYPLFTQRVAEYEKELKYIDNVLTSFQTYDWREYEKIQGEMEEVFNVIQGYTYLQLQPLDIPNFQIQIVEDIHLEPIVRDQLIEPAKYLTPIQSINDLVTILNGTCPTCGKSLIG